MATESAARGAAASNRRAPRKRPRIYGLRGLCRINKKIGAEILPVFL
jgi:hypothetical protein